MVQKIKTKVKKDIKLSNLKNWKNGVTLDWNGEIVEEPIWVKIQVDQFYTCYFQMPTSLYICPCSYSSIYFPLVIKKRWLKSSTYPPHLYPYQVNFTVLRRKLKVNGNPEEVDSFQVEVPLPPKGRVGVPFAINIVKRWITSSVFISSEHTLYTLDVGHHESLYEIIFINFKSQLESDCIWTDIFRDKRKVKSLEYLLHIWLVSISHVSDMKWEPAFYFF